MVLSSLGATTGKTFSILVYLPLFLDAGFGWTAETAGLGMLAATLPMLVIPPFGGRLASQLG